MNNLGKVVAILGVGAMGTALGICISPFYFLTKVTNKAIDEYGKTGKPINIDFDIKKKDNI